MELKTTPNKVMGIQNLGNPNNYKYADRILEDFNTTTEIKKSKLYRRENESVTRVQTSYLETLLQLAKANNADTIDLYLGDTDKVLHLAMYDNGERTGLAALAPIKNDEGKFEEQRKEYKTLKML